jgi:hypothetical protein
VRPIVHRLAAAGIRLAIENEAVRSECMRIARVARDRGCGTLGVLPASPRVSVLPVALQLARALVGLDGDPVAVVDADGQWPVQPAQATPAGAAPFVTERITDELVLFMPPRDEPRDPLERLLAILERRDPSFGHILVDLSGLGRRGEHVAAMALVDGVIVLARAGETRDAELRRVMADVPPRANLGALLYGVKG